MKKDFIYVPINIKDINLCKGIIITKEAKENFKKICQIEKEIEMNNYIKNISELLKISFEKIRKKRINNL